LGKEVINGSTVYKQRNKRTGKVTYTRIPPKAQASRLTVDEQGRVIWERGELPAVTTGVKTDLQKKEFEAGLGLSRINSIIQNFKPEYQELGTRWGHMWGAAKEKLGVKLSPVDKQKLSEFSTYRKEAVATTNKLIFDLTGKQMYKHEAKRLMKGLPNPGTGFFDGDAPTEFISALNVTHKDLLRVQARTRYYQARNLDMAKQIKQGKVMSLGDFDDIINEYGAMVEEALRAREPDLERANPSEFYKRVRDKVKAEFGL
jgi:hypothetical protein